MFGWRRKSDGFEWREYVRTTIKLRREERARKIDEIKHKAASGAKAAGRQGMSAGYSGLEAIRDFAVAAGRWCWSMAVAGLRRLGSGLAALATGVRSGDIRGRIQGLRVPSLALSSRAKIAAMFGGLGVLAGLSAFLQFRQSGVDWSTLLAAVVALVLIGLAVTPWLRNAWHRLRSGFGDAPIARPQLPLHWVGGAAGAVLALGAGLWIWQGGLSSVSSAVVAALPSWQLPSLQVSSLPDITGRGRAITGDTLRIDGRVVDLAGIEAPEISQVCRDRRKRAWRCGQSARQALRRVVGRRRIVCTNVVEAEGGRLKATCQVGSKDVAAAVVNRGYAFAQGSIFKAYAEAESEARDARRGIWQGTVQRPADFRAQRWERASKAAPDGCPIKGRVVRRSKVYVLPWALEYRQVRVRRRRGERWFCSEAEAAAAGFKPSSAG